MEDPEIQAILVEYQAAQASAEHHDTLIWHVTSIVWGATVVLLGIAASSIAPGGPKIAIVAICVVNVVLLAFVTKIQGQLRDVKLQKYRRCQEIEEQTGMRQHSHLDYSGGSQTDAYTWVTVVLILACIAIGLIAWFIPNGAIG